jgi:glycosyltransferase involved in cell wall biosynthesis
LQVLAFGTYQRDYPRHAQVVSCLRGAGVDVSERHVPVWRGRHGWSAGPGTAARLALAQARLLARGRARGVDALLVGYLGHADVPAARLAARGIPLVFDPLVSLHDTLVDDRRRFSPGSIPARALRRIDRAALRGADLVIADTAAGAARLRELGDLPADRVEVCLVGAEERLFRPGWHRTERFHALFVGKLIPLHGLETILAAARLVPDVRFRVVGTGQLESLLRDRPANVDWVDWVDYERLPAENHDAGCVLGIFGTSAKAARVIPNKAFQALACGAPLVTADTPAARELLADGGSALLVPPGDPEALATAVRRLRDDAALAERIAAGGSDAYRERASEEVLGRRWRELFERVVG